MEELINIHTGKVADRNINTYEGYEIGLKIIESMTGIDINKITFKEKDRTVIMKSKSSVKIDNEEIVGHGCPTISSLSILMDDLGFINASFSTTHCFSPGYWL